MDPMGLNPFFFSCVSATQRAIDECGDAHVKAYNDVIEKFVKCKGEAVDCLGSDSSGKCKKFACCRQGYGYSLCTGRICAKEKEKWEQYNKDRNTPACQKALIKMSRSCAKKPRF